MIMRRGQGGMAHGSAVEVAQNPIGQQEVAEHTGNDQILAEQPLKQWTRQHVPGNGVGNGGEDPIQLPQRSLPIVDLAGDGIDSGGIEQAGPTQRILTDEPPEGDGDGRR
mmetsp:Transcript_21798/g.47157  ORF Transcript_21798/g.47157 Transcript_21798/m.47157 type:complete len:110 (+) Transcript_21798:336-665(+)